MRSLRSRLRRDESGATFVLVAVSLVALLGMAVLVVDVGGMLVMRRRLVNAADAAALAAAQSCATTRGSEAPGQADALAAANVTSSARTAFRADGCGTGSSGSVTVKYQATQPLFFAPVLGLGSTATVTADATAIWRPSPAGIALPIKVNLVDGTIPCTTQPVGTSCNYWHDNSNNDVANGGNWDFVNLVDRWDVSSGSNCPNPGAGELAGWIRTGVPVRLNASGRTYACATQGFKAVDWFRDLQTQIGQRRLFPVNDPSTMVMDTGVVRYSIVGFLPLRIQGVLRGDDPAALDACPGHAPDANAICLVATWEGAQLGEVEGTGGSAADWVRSIRLAG